MEWKLNYHQNLCKPLRNPVTLLKVSLYFWNAKSLFFSFLFGNKKKLNLFKEAKSEGVPVYGLTRNVGQFKDETIDPDRNYDFELIAMHSTILGDDCETYPLKVKLKIKTHLNFYQKFSIEKKTR